MGVQRFDLLVLGKRGEDVVDLLEWVLGRGESLDERSSAFEELRELVLGQLPR
jgi:hypothetical protein